jgi:hypothetical protein
MNRLGPSQVTLGLSGHGSLGVAMPQMLRSGLMGYLCRALAVATAMLVAMAAGSVASAFDIKKVEASVYKVFATPKGSTGTGFLVSGRRTVITNFHVIEKNTEFMVIYRDGKEVQVAAARVIAYKPNLDLAVLRVDRDLPGTALTLAEFEPDKLTNVVTVGFPAAADDAVKGRPLTVPMPAPCSTTPPSIPATAAVRCSTSAPTSWASTRWSPSTRRVCSFRSMPVRWCASCARPASSMPPCALPA